MKLNKKHFLVITVVVIALLIQASFITYGKYISNSIWEYYLKSKGFYFSSELLSIDNQTTVNSNWDGSSVEFSLNNNLNDLIAASSDIEYELECNIISEANEYADCVLNDTTLNKITKVLKSEAICENKTTDLVDTKLLTKEECTEQNYDWVFKPVMDDNYFSILLNNNNYSLKEVTVEIKATSKKPFERVLTGQFVLNKNTLMENQITHQYTRFDNYGALVITNSNDVDTCLSIKWDPQKFTLISDKSLFTELKENSEQVINEGKLLSSKKSGLEIRFIQSNPLINYGNENFIVTKETAC